MTSDAFMRAVAETKHQAGLVRWLARDLFALLDRAERDGLSIGPEDALDGKLLAEWRDIHTRARILGLLPKGT